MSCKPAFPLNDQGAPLVWTFLQSIRSQLETSHRIPFIELHFIGLGGFGPGHLRPRLEFPSNHVNPLKIVKPTSPLASLASPIIAAVEFVGEQRRSRHRERHAEPSHGRGKPEELYLTFHAYRWRTRLRPRTSKS